MDARGGSQRILGEVLGSFWLRRCSRDARTQKSVENGLRDPPRDPAGRQNSDFFQILRVVFLIVVLIIVLEGPYVQFNWIWKAF